MAITSYPRVTIQGTGPSQNPPNGQGLMLLNPSTNKYEPATASTFSGGGGGGDATSANQTTQINEAIAQTSYLNDVKNNTNILTESNLFLDSIINSGLYYDGTYAAQYLYQIRIHTESINKFTNWNTFSSKIYHNGSGTTTFQLNDAVRIVFHDSVVVNNLFDATSTSVTSTYFEAEPTGADYTTAPNSEIISIGNNANDRFSEIEVVGKCTFTAYYLITPYV